MRVEPRPSILTVEPYVGGESKLPGVNRVMKLSSNEGPFGPPPGAIEALRAAAADAHRYPDGSARALREAIGARFALDPARIVCGNGSDEILTLLLLAYSGEGTKIVLTGDPYQIDNPYVDAASNGFTYVVNRFRDQAIAAHVELSQGERSELAETAANIL
jgi:histidinol-phosphate aminotransferase